MTDTDTVTVTFQFDRTHFTIDTGLGERLCFAWTKPDDYEEAMRVIMGLALELAAIKDTV